MTSNRHIYYTQQTRLSPETNDCDAYTNKSITLILYNIQYLTIYLHDSVSMWFQLVLHVAKYDTNLLIIRM